MEEEQDQEMPGPSAREHLPILTFLLSDSRYGKMWLTYVDKDAYGNNLLHVCIDLHNIDFTKLVLAKNIEYGTNLL